LVIVHEDLVPPESFSGMSDREIQEVCTEDDVIVGLQELGHEVKVLGLYEELAPLREALQTFEPHIVFNLLEEFRGQPLLDYHIVAYLMLRDVAYTGCNPRGLLIARDKALSKKILHYHRMRVPRFATFPRGRRIRRPKRLDFPLIVKSQTEEASHGIAQASVVSDDEALIERVRFIHDRIGTAAIAEQFIEGRELYVAVMGNQRLQTMPPWELLLTHMPEDAHRIATRKVKFDLDYQAKHKIDIRQAGDLGDELLAEITKTSKRIYRRLELDGYARIDYRLSDDGKLYFLEANPNPDIAEGEEFASASEAAGLSYNDMLQRIVSLGLRRSAM
jgi:D-alanine-D-alanine ligase